MSLIVLSDGLDSSKVNKCFIGVSVCYCNASILNNARFAGLLHFSCFFLVIFCFFLFGLFFYALVSMILSLYIIRYKGLYVDFL